MLGTGWGGVGVAPTDFPCQDRKYKTLGVCLPPRRYLKVSFPIHGLSWDWVDTGLG